MTQTTTSQKRRRHFRRTKGAQPFELQDRDEAILRLVHEMRFCSTAHIGHLVEGSYQRIQYRLRAMYDEGYLDRPPKQGARAYGKNRPFVYALGARGAELLKSRGVPGIRGDWKHKNELATFLTINHQLMIADFRAALVLALRESGAGELLFWRQGHEMLDHAVSTAGGRRQSIPVAPDAWFAIRLGQGKTRHFFLEADNSTMRGDRYHKKLTGYFWYWMAAQDAYSAQYRRKKGVFAEADPFRVLTIAKTDVRASNLFALAKEIGPQKKPTSMFWFAPATAYDLAEPGKILEEMWQVWTKDGERRKMALI